MYTSISQGGKSRIRAGALLIGQTRFISIRKSRI